MLIAIVAVSFLGSISVKFAIEREGSVEAYDRRERLGDFGGSGDRGALSEPSSNDEICRRANSRSKASNSKK